MQRVIQSHPGYPPSLRMRLKCLWLNITWEELSSHTGTQTVMFISQDLLSLPARLRGASIIFIPGLCAAGGLPHSVPLLDLTQLL